MGCRFTSRTVVHNDFVQACHRGTLTRILRSSIRRVLHDQLGRMSNTQILTLVAFFKHHSVHAQGKRVARKLKKTAVYIPLLPLLSGASAKHARANAEEG